MKLSIMAFSHRLFSGDVSSVVLPSELGPFQVLDKHAPTLSSLTAGNVTYRVGGELSSIQVKGGFVSIAHNQINVVCEPMDTEEKVGVQ